jgi:tetratricopeptide (TPR) repeat protein
LRLPPRALVAALATAVSVVGAARAYALEPGASADAAAAAPSEHLTIDQAVHRLGLFDAEDGRSPRGIEEEAAPPLAAAPGSAMGGPEARDAQPAPMPAEGEPAADEPVGAVPPTPAPAVRPAPDWRQIPGRRLLDWARARLPVLARDAAEDLRAGTFSRRAQGALAAVAGALALLALALRGLLRGRGEVVVRLDYSPSLQGTFCVKLATRPLGDSRVAMRGRIKSPADAVRAKERSGGSATEHHMVSRETQFRAVAARRWYVTVDGFLQTCEGDDVVCTHFEEQELRLRRGASERLIFDISPRACPVEVKVVWDKRPVQEARVALRGVPGSLRLARSGPVQMALAPGRHTLVVGAADRVAERELEIESFDPIHLRVDLSDRQQLLFSGCPPAVEPYLAGDVAAAARALDRDGLAEMSHRLLARFHLERGQHETAAAHFEAAGELAQAAELWQSTAKFERAAQLFEQAGDDDRAAENFRSAGKLLRAGDAYARAGSYDSAVDCFSKAGDVGRWIDSLAKSGRVYEAAKVALDQGDRSRAIQYLSAVAVSDPDYPDAVVHLAQAYEAEGHVGLAIYKLEELVATRGDEVRLEAIDLLAQLCEQAAEFEKALQALERLRRRDPGYPSLATRIEELKKRRSRQGAVSGSTTQPGGGAAEFSSEFRYEILEELGRGGMGIVFKARDRRLGRNIALKRLPDNLRDHPKAVELFLREARAAAALNHPNIVTLFDAGQEGGTCYITMELLEGMPLHKVLRARGRLSAGNVAKIGGQVATGLAYAHEQGIVHRDIKTANLFFTTQKVVKIMDFGLAKMVEEVRRSTTVIGGTPYYMAPEQSAGQQVDHRADLYSLGVTFYELLTGSVPFREGDVTFHHRHTPPTDPRQIAPDIPDALADLVLQMLAKSPDDRVRSAGEVVARLQEITRA